MNEYLYFNIDKTTLNEIILIYLLHVPAKRFQFQGKILYTRASISRNTAIYLYGIHIYKYVHTHTRICNLNETFQGSLSNYGIFIPK